MLDTIGTESPVNSADLAVSAALPNIVSDCFALELEGLLLPHITRTELPKLEVF